ncbi:MAG: hypothetical protein JWP75_3567 [Frondihabitans sp.]|nr:hypothetical protein [Frondihabitans sp.]
MGGLYTVVADKAAKLSVSGGQAHIRNLARAKAVTATLKSVAARDVEIQGTMVMPGHAPIVYHAYQMRTQNDGTLYRGRIDVLAGGAVDLTISRMEKNNVEVTLARKRMSFRAGADTAITSDFQVTGTSPVTIRGRAWLAGSTEPGWQLTTSDSSTHRVTATGHVGLWEYSSASNASTIGTDEDDLLVTNNPTSPVTATPTPTSTPTTPTSPDPTTQEPLRGSLPVGSSDYPIPAGAIFVSPSGNDASSGSESDPLRTLAAAITQAVSGDTIVLRAGTYNESVSIPESKPNLTVQAYPYEAVWLDGSIPVTSWTKTGSTWTTYGWDHFFANTLDGIADNPYFVDTAHYPLAARADMVFYDGVQLTQVASASAVRAGTFAVDQAAKTITIGSDPAGHDLRASNQMQAIYAKSAGTTLEGFGVRRYATPYNVRGAIRLGGVGETARNLVIQDSATTGMNFEADNITLDHLTVTRSGMQGLGGNATYNTKLINSVVSYANDEHFNESPVSGGVKITRSRDLVIQNNDFVDNYSFGLWLDESCYDPHIIDNTMSGNTGHGLEVEISAGAIIADNSATSNGKSGIRLLDTSNSQIYNNSIGDNGIFGIQLSQDERRESDLSVPGHDPRQPEPDPSFTWLTQNDTVANNSFGAGGQFQIYALDNWTNIPVDQWHLTITGNLFNSQASSSQVMVAWGGSDNVTLYRYNTPAALAAAKNPSWTNAQTLSAQPLSEMATAVTSAQPIATPLPADVAAAVGQPVGTRHIGTF